MSKLRYGTYLFLLGMLIAGLLGWFSEDIVALTGFEWMGSLVFLVVVAVTLPELLMYLIFGHRKGAEPQEGSSFLGDGGRGKQQLRGE